MILGGINERASMADVVLPPLVVSRRTGREPFHDGPTPLDFDLLSFWQWSASDLMSNVLRGRLAEFRVARALGIANGVRVEWAAFDLRTLGGTTIEVKSAAYIQSWTQRKLSTIIFDIAPTRFWDETTNLLAAEARRQAGLYVFALLAHRDKASIDAMNVAQWEFFVLPAAVLDTRLPRQRQVGLKTLLKLDPLRCRFGELRGAIEKIANTASLGVAPSTDGLPA
jgi:hypothetical protein